MKRKIEKCMYWEFLPDTYKRTRTLKTSDKNVLAVMIFHYYQNSDYRREHDGWFMLPTKRLEDESGVDDNTVAISITRFRLQGIIFTTLGKNIPNVTKNDKNYRIRHIRFSSQLVELLIDIDEIEKNNGIQDKTRQEERRLEEIREDESRQDETSLIYKDSASLESELEEASDLPF